MFFMLCMCCPTCECVSFVSSRFYACVVKVMRIFSWVACFLKLQCVELSQKCSINFTDQLLLSSSVSSQWLQSQQAQQPTSCHQWQHCFHWVRRSCKLIITQPSVTPSLCCGFYQLIIHQFNMNGKWLGNGKWLHCVYRSQFQLKQVWRHSNLYLNGGLNIHNGFFFF